jgi:hypothetical protein
VYERRYEKLAPLPVFARRLAKSIGIALILILASLSIGIAGYRFIAGFGWVDSLLEASMILGGMGPINSLTTNGAKVFASVYALFSGLIFIGVLGITLAPIVHRTLHMFHVDEHDVGTDSTSSDSSDD